MYYLETLSSDFWKYKCFVHALNHVVATLWDMHALRHFNYFGSDSDNIMDNYDTWHSQYCCFRRQSFSSQLPLFSLLLFFTKDMSRWNKVRFRPLRTSKHQQGICDAKWHRDGKREIIKYRKDGAEVKHTKYAKDEGHIQKLRWFYYTIRKDKVILL